MGILKRIERLDGVKDDLVEALKLGVSRCSFDCTVAEGLRTRQSMMVNYGKGRTAAQLQPFGIPASFAMPGVSKVTWLRDPFASKHATGDAVDVYPLVNGQLANTRDDLPLFREMYEKVMAAGRELKVDLRYGADWDGDGKLFEQGETDAVHFELVPGIKPAMATA